MRFSKNAIRRRADSGSAIEPAWIPVLRMAMWAQLLRLAGPGAARRHRRRRNLAAGGPAADGAGAEDPLGVPRPGLMGGGRGRPVRVSRRESSRAVRPGRRSVRGPRGHRRSRRLVAGLRGDHRRAGGLRGGLRGRAQVLAPGLLGPGAGRRPRQPLPEALDLPGTRRAEDPADRHRHPGSSHAAGRADLDDGRTRTESLGRTALAAFRLASRPGHDPASTSAWREEE